MILSLIAAFFHGHIRFAVHLILPLLGGPLKKPLDLLSSYGVEILHASLQAWPSKPWRLHEGFAVDQLSPAFEANNFSPICLEESLDYVMFMQQEARSVTSPPAPEQVDFLRTRLLGFGRSAVAGWVPWMPVRSRIRRVADLINTHADNIVAMHQVAVPLHLQPESERVYIVQLTSDVAPFADSQLLIIELHRHRDGISSPAFSRLVARLPRWLVRSQLLRAVYVHAFCRRVNDRCIVLHNSNLWNQQDFARRAVQHGDFIAIHVPPETPATPWIDNSSSSSGDCASETAILTLSLICLNLRTWFIHHVNWHTCDTPRLVHIPVQSNDWLRYIADVWFDRFEVGAATRISVLHPQPIPWQLADDSLTMHVLVEQGLRSDRAAVVVANDPMIQQLPRTNYNAFSVSALLNNDRLLQEVGLIMPCQQVGPCHCHHGQRRISSTGFELMPTGAFIQVLPQAVEGDYVTLWQLQASRMTSQKIGHEDEVDSWEPFRCDRDELDPCEELPPVPHLPPLERVPWFEGLPPIVVDPEFLTLRTWCLRGQTFPRCEFFRDLRTPQQVDEIADALRRTWADCLDPSASFEFHVDQLEHTQFAFFGPELITKHDAVVAARAVADCYVEHFFFDCIVRQLPAHALGSAEHLEIHHGAGLTLEVTPSLPDVSVPDIPPPQSSVFWPSNADWSAPMEQLEVIHSRLVRMFPVDAVPLNAWFLHHGDSLHCTVSRLVVLPSDATQWETTIRATWRDRIDPDPPLSIHRVVPQPAEDLVHPRTEHIVIEQAKLLAPERQAVLLGITAGEHRNLIASSVLNPASPEMLIWYIGGGAVAHAHRPEALHTSGEVGTIKIPFHDVLLAHSVLDAHLFLPRYDLFDVPDLLPASLEWLQLPWFDLLWPAQRIHIYFDGSFDEASNTAGYAVVAFALTEHGWTFAGSLASALSGCTDSYRPELFAALAASKFAFDFCKLQEAAHSTPPLAHFAFDALTVGKQMMGHWQALQHTRLVAFARNLWILCEHRFSVASTGEHTCSHRGEPGNELADSLATLARLGRFDTSLDDWHSILQLPGFVEASEWFWLLHDPSLQGFLHDGFLAVPKFASTVPTVEAFPLDVLEPRQSHDALQCDLDFKLCSANVLALKAGSDTNVASVADAPGPSRQDALLQQFHDDGITIFGLQETRLRQQQLSYDDRFILISSPATSNGHRGLLLGLSQTTAFGSFADAQGVQHQIYFDDHCYSVIAATPRWLLVRIVTRIWKGILIVAHAPHAGHALSEIHDWWEQLAAALPKKYGSWDKILLVDANARVGSEPSEAIGSHQAEATDEKSEPFMMFIHSMNLFLPSTFHLHQIGDAGTWKHPRGHWLRNDFVALIRLPHFTLCEAWVSLDLDLSLEHEDHRAVIVHAKWSADVPFDVHARPRHRKQRLDPTLLPWDWHPRIVLPAFAVDVHTHAASLERQMVKALRHVVMKKLVCLHFWRFRRVPQELHKMEREQNHEAALLLSKFQQLGRQVKVALRIDDVRFYQSLLAAGSDFVAPAQAKELWRVVRRSLPAHRARRQHLPPLKNEVLEDQWEPYLQTLEAGVTTQPCTLVQDCHDFQSQRAATAPSELPLHFLPTIRQVESAFRANKSTGLDPLPAGLFFILSYSDDTSFLPAPAQGFRLAV
eukprot:Skav229842  [mRNA]  locus=scaffold2033:162783:168356:- [translate_table: standard]